VCEMTTISGLPRRLAWCTERFPRPRGVHREGAASEGRAMGRACIARCAVWLPASSEEHVTRPSPDGISSLSGFTHLPPVVRTRRRPWTEDRKSGRRASCRSTDTAPGADRSAVCHAGDRGPLHGGGWCCSGSRRPSRSGWWLERRRLGRRPPRFASLYTASRLSLSRSPCLSGHR
jgi:hypothetical protein